MTICILTTGYPRWKNDFDTNYIHYLAKELVKMNIKVYVIAPHAPGLKKKEIMNGVNIYRFQYFFLERMQSLAYSPGIPENIKKFRNKIQIPFFIFFMFFNLMFIQRKIKCDVLNAHCLVPSGFLGIIFKRLFGQPVVTKIYGADISLIKSKLPFLKKFFSHTIKKSNVTIANSTYTQKIAEEFFNIEPGKIITIHDGVDIHRYFPDLEIRDKECLKQFQDKVIILSCGRLVERKGFRYVIEALPELKKSVPNILYILIGSGPEQESLERLAIDLGVREQILFLNRVSDADLFKYYSLSDVFVLPAVIDSNGDTEGLGLVLLEAMASGKPVIGSRVGGIPDIIPPGSDYGFLTSPENVQELREQLLKILKNVSLRKKMGQKARKMAEENFSWEAIAKKYRDVLIRASKAN